MTYEELLRLITSLTKIGIDRIKITGGEPLVRNEAVELSEE